MKSNLFVCSFVGVLAMLAACSSNDEKDVAGGVSEDAGFVADVAGVAQKGPFVKGSAVTVRGIDCKTLEFTDQVFEGAIKSDKGDFALDSVALDTSCAVVEVTGKYLNEVTGKKTKGELTLRALTDLKNRENVNVNLLTNLEYERVMYLVKEKNKTLAKAKTQAESEVLAAFDIKGEIDEFENLNVFESGDGNAALLAVSVIMQGDADETALAKRLDNFDDSFAESGEWKDSETKKAIAEWVAEASANGKLDSIRKNIEGLDYADEIPAFEKYVPAVEPADSIEEESSSSDESSSSVEESSSSDVIASEAKQSSSSEKQNARDSVVTSSSSEAVADTASSSSVVPKDTTLRDTVVRDTSSVKPDTSVAKEDSVVTKKDTSGCPNTEFPHELNYLLGNDYEIASARCPGDSVVVTWRTRHDVYETEFSVPRTYTFAAEFEQYSTDSLDRFRSEWLGSGSGFEVGGEYDESIVDLGNELYDYPYDEEDLSEIGETTPVYSYRMDLKNASYLVYVFSVPQLLVRPSGSRTIRYGFVVELSAVYVTK
ncbi:MAG: hypothetical protein IJ912_04795 [Fibrobacter sp.]|nr:hypothetical protein [Fibrobacter sp.]